MLTGLQLAAPTGGGRLIELTQEEVAWVSGGINYEMVIEGVLLGVVGVVVVTFAAPLALAALGAAAAGTASLAVTTGLLTATGSVAMVLGGAAIDIGLSLPDSGPVDVSVTGYQMNDYTPSTPTGSVEIYSITPSGTWVEIPTVSYDQDWYSWEGYCNAMSGGTQGCYDYFGWGQEDDSGSY